MQDFNPKLSDFGLARHGPLDDQSRVFTRVLGTKGYFAPEYFTTGIHVFVYRKTKWDNVCFFRCTHVLKKNV